MTSRRKLKVGHVTAATKNAVAKTWGLTAGPHGRKHSDNRTFGTALINNSFDAETTGIAIDTLPSFFSGGASVVNTEQAYGGSGKSIKTTIQNASEGFGNWGCGYTFDAPLSAGDEIWWRVRMRVPTGFDWTTNTSPMRLKALRIRTKEAGGSHLGYVDTYFYSPTASSVTRVDAIYEPGVGPFAPSDVFSWPSDTWATFEYYVRLGETSADDGGKGLIRVWKDGLLISEVTSKNTMMSRTDVADFVYLLTYWNGSSPATQSLWFDDFTIYTTNTGAPGSTDAAGNSYIGVS